MEETKDNPQSEKYKNLKNIENSLIMNGAIKDLYKMEYDLLKTENTNFHLLQ